MRRTIALSFLALFMPSILFAFGEYVDDSVYTSSFTTTNDSFVSLSSAPNSSFYGVCVGSATIGTGTLKVFDGQVGPTLSTITIMSLQTQGCQAYNVQVSSGLMYATSGNVSGVTIIYRNRHVQ